VRRDRARLDAALAGAAVLSLLAAPHAGTHDLVMLAPAMAWSIALGLRLDAIRQAPQRISATFVAAGLTLLVSAAAFISLADGASPPFGQLTPWVLIAAAIVAWRATRTPVGDLGLTSPLDATAVGPVADGVRRWPGSAGRGLLPLHRRSG